MRKSLLIFLTSFAGWAQQAGNLQIFPVDGDVFVYTTYKDINGTKFPSNSAYIVTRDGVVLLDTPWNNSQFQPLVDSIASRHQKKIVLCIATHSHDDRTAGVEFLNKLGVKTYASERTRRLCQMNGEKVPEYGFKKDTVFEVGGRHIETFYPGEGHTSDNIVVWLEEEKILYGGCFVKSTENDGLGNTADANLKKWPRSLKRAMRKFRNIKTVIPGHFGWQGNGLTHTLKLLKAVPKS